MTWCLCLRLQPASGTPGDMGTVRATGKDYIPEQYGVRITKLIKKIKFVQFPIFNSTLFHLVWVNACQYPLTDGPSPVRYNI